MPFALLTTLTTMVAFAAESPLLTEVDSTIVATRFDVPLCDAIADESFSTEALQNSEDESLATTRAVTWNVWGSKQIDSSTHWYAPVGYSAHVNGTTVLNTYHYTRTFLNTANDPHGDSGRVWGYQTVKAVGTPCMPDVWDAFIHGVYYGTTDD